MKNKSEVIFDKNTIEFVTVAAEFCSFLEKTNERSRDEFVNTALKFLPLLYLKASLISPCERMGIDELEQSVSEGDYEFIRTSVKQVMGSQDDYLEVFTPDIQYSEGALTCEISEDMADIYQDVRDFVEMFKTENNITMNDALVTCKEHFADYWGQKLVNSMRALHDAKYNQHDEEDNGKTQTGYADNDD